MYCCVWWFCGVPTKKVDMNLVRSSHNVLCKALLMCLQVPIGIKEERANLASESMFIKGAIGKKRDKPLKCLVIS